MIVMPKHAPRRTAVAVLAVLAVAAACSDGGSEAGSDASSPTPVPSQAEDRAVSEEDEPVQTRPYEFAVHEEVFVDETRPTPAGSQTPEQPSRTLVTDVYLPETTGPVPLIVFSHGLAGHPDKFTELFAAWATAGYGVAAPAFPLTNDEVPGSGGNAGDLASQPADVSFVLDRLLELNDDAASPLDGRFDEDRLAAAGLSLGGATTYSAAIDTGTRDTRFGPVIVLAGLSPAELDRTDALPVLVMHGTTDPAIPIERARGTYEQLSSPRYFVSLLGGGHAEPFEDSPSDFDDYTPTVTTAFWDVYLGSGGAEVPDWPALLVVDGLTEVVYDEG